MNTFILITTNLISFAIGCFATGKVLYNFYKEQVQKNEELKSVLIPRKTHSQSQQNVNKQLAEVICLANHR